MLAPVLARLGGRGGLHRHPNPDEVACPQIAGILERAEIAKTAPQVAAAGNALTGATNMPARVRMMATLRAELTAELIRTLFGAYTKDVPITLGMDRTRADLLAAIYIRPAARAITWYAPRHSRVRELGGRGRAVL